MICVLQNINSNVALSYIGGVSGVNAGSGGNGIIDCENHTTIYITVKDDEIHGNNNLVYNDCKINI